MSGQPAASYIGWWRLFTRTLSIKHNESIRPIWLMNTSVGALSIHSMDETRLMSARGAAEVKRYKQ